MDIGQAFLDTLSRGLTATGVLRDLTPTLHQLVHCMSLSLCCQSSSDFVGHDGTGFLLLLWIDSTYLSIGIPVRKQRKSHETAVKHLLERHSLSSKGEARAKIAKKPSADGQY